MSASHFHLLLQVVLLLGVLLGTSVSTYWGGPSYHKTPGTPCTPSVWKPCGEKKLISEVYYPCGPQCKGQNVCKRVRTFQKHFYSCVYQKKCYKSFWSKSNYCRYYCKQTDNCDHIQTTSTTQYTCCKGFTTAPSPSDYHHYLYSKSILYLKKKGCPRAIVNTTLQCLTELGLTELTNLLTDLPLEDTLNTPGQQLTIFAPTNEFLSLAGSLLESLPDRILNTILQSHVVNRDLPAVKLYDGQKVATMANRRFLHVTEIELKRRISVFKYKYYERIFINGQELLSRDACIATNGRVHIIKGLIDSSNLTISQVVQNSENLTALTCLLNTSNLLGYLNRPKPLLTLFAPTDEAFETASEDLGLDILRCLKSPAKRKALKNFLLYHMTCGAEYSATLNLHSQLKTKVCYKSIYSYYQLYKYFSHKYYTKCKKVQVQVGGDGGILVGKEGAVITHLDIPASNGVVHYVSLPLVNPWYDLRVLCKNFPIVNRNVAPPPPPLLHPPPY